MMPYAGWHTNVSMPKSVWQPTCLMNNIIRETTLLYKGGY